MVGGRSAVGTLVNYWRIKRRGCKSLKLNKLPTNWFLCDCSDDSLHGWLWRNAYISMHPFTARQLPTARKTHLPTNAEVSPVFWLNYLLPDLTLSGNVMSRYCKLVCGVIGNAVSRLHHLFANTHEDITALLTDVQWWPVTTAGLLLHTPMIYW